MTEPTVFWMVWNDGGLSPTFKHITEQSAKLEAERLARKHGGRFYVLVTVAACERSDVQWQDTVRREMPF